jgi:hypothetical protein
MNIDEWQFFKLVEKLDSISKHLEGIDKVLQAQTITLPAKPANSL